MSISGSAAANGPLLLRTLQLQAQFIESNGFGVDNRHNEISLLLLALRRLAQAD